MTAGEFLQTLKVSLHCERGTHGVYSPTLKYRNDEIKCLESAVARRPGSC